VAGHRQSLAVHHLAYAINSVLGSLNKTVEFRPAPAFALGSIGDLAASLNKKEVDTLVILGGNPVFNAPADLNWVATQRLAKTVVRLGYYEDETAAVSDLHLPVAHYLESWGDVRTSDGTVVIVQPLIRPLFGGLTELEVIARLGGLAETDAYKITRETLGGNEEAWKKALHDGFVAGSAVKPINAAVATGVLAPALAGVSASAPSKDSLELIFTADNKIDDGAHQSQDR
jgi:anaerobic selenocysteine-containing dehydrogenase